MIAHRGTGPGTRSISGRLYSEDTIPAFQEAMRRGADGFETDYWPTQDGRLVSHHDETLPRMTDGEGAVARRPWTYVRTLTTPSGAALATASMVETSLEGFGGFRQQEIKRGDRFTDGLLKQLLYMDQTRKLTDKSLITSSELHTLRRVQDLEPTMATGLIVRTPTGRPDIGSLPRWLDVILIDIQAADADYARWASAAGLTLSVRGVDTIGQLHLAVAIGAKRVVTDRPEVVGSAC